MKKKLAAATALGALALAPTMQPSQAAGSFSGEAPAPSLSSGAVGTPPLIQGLVVDRAGHFLNNVEVVAVRASGVVAASALTYASNWADGPQNGYFYLEVGKTGTYTLTLSRTGYVTRTLSSVEIVRLRQKLALGEITLTRKLADTKVAAKLPDTRITTNDKGKVDVTVSSTATRKPTGAVEIREGKAVLGSGKLAAGDKGHLKVTLKKLARGSHDLKAYFLGSSSLKKSDSRAVTLTVKKPRRHRAARPNAW